MSKKTIVVLVFIVSVIVVSVEWVCAQYNYYTNNKFLVFSWGIFYISCLLITIYGFAKTAALEGTVYCLSILGEAFAPGLSENLISRLPGIDVGQSHALLTVTAHLTLTLAACAIVIGWGGVLIFTRMRDGNTPIWAIIYVLLIVFGGIAIIIWGFANPASLIGLEAAKSGRYIPGLWPSMVDSWLSYVRIILALATLFLPWVKAAMPVGNTPNQHG